MSFVRKWQEKIFVGNRVKGNQNEKELILYDQLDFSIKVLEITFVDISFVSSSI